MKKQFNISYLWTGGEAHLSTTSLFELGQYLDKVQDDPNVIQGTVDIQTVDIPA